LDCLFTKSSYTLPVIRNIIFDWSGTLVDDLPAVLQATNYVLTQANCGEMTVEQFRAEFQLPFTAFYDKHTPHVPLLQLEDWFHSRFKQVQNSVCPLPYAARFIEFCRTRKLRTFVLSTVREDHFKIQHKASGFGEVFEKTYLGVRDKRQKIHDMIAENGLSPGETLFIGDMKHDIETARHGGLHCCAVLTGYNTLQDLRSVQPDLIVEHLGELREILEANDLHLRSRSKCFEESHPPIATVGALIFNKAGEALMIRTHKWSNLWGIPGGKIKRGEPSEDALRREIKEETDLDVTDIQFVLVQDCIHSKEFYRDAHFVLLNYTCRCTGRSVVKLNDEAWEFRWVETDAALKMPINAPTRKLLEAVAANEASRRNKH